MFYIALSDFILFFFNSIFVISFLIFGYYHINKHAFLNASVICMFTCVVNLYLKSYWMAPLNTEIGVFGWAYPSGHTTFNIVFWGALAIQLRKIWIYNIALIVFPLALIAMITRRYHTFVDIIGGICLGLAILAAFYPLIKNGELLKRITLIVIFIITAVLLFLHPPVNGYSFNYIPILGFLITLMIVEDVGNKENKFWYSVYNTIFCIGLAYIFTESVTYLFYKDIPSQLTKGAGLAAILIYSPKLLNKLKMKFRKSVLAFW